MSPSFARRGMTTRQTANRNNRVAAERCPVDYPRCQVVNRPAVEECGDLETGMVQRKAPSQKHCVCWIASLAIGHSGL